jgi:O-methyltransferase
MTTRSVDARSQDERSAPAIALYLDLMKRMLTRIGFVEPYRPFTVPRSNRLAFSLFAAAYFVLSRFGLELMTRRSFDASQRERGVDRPYDAETMIGMQRLDNLQRCVEDVIRNNVPGDLIETGIWRGGACILMRAILKVYGVTDRLVWAADSFQGLPKPDAKRYAADAGDLHWTRIELAISLDEVKTNFARYELLDDQIRFLVGWFKDTLPTAPIDRLAVVRLDGDMYESTIQSLDALYPKLSVGGYLIVDDYHAVPGCRQAVEDYRRARGLREPILGIDGVGVYWRRER